MNEDDWARALLREGPDEPAPRAARELLAESRPPSPTPVLWLVVTVLLLAVGATFVARRSESAPPLRTRGQAAPSSLQLGLLLDQEGLPALSGPVPRGTRVLFQATSEQPGFLCLDELSRDGWTRVHPARGKAWRVEVGPTVPRGPSGTFSWRPGEAVGIRSYRLRIHPDDPGCDLWTAETELDLLWLP